MNGAQEEAIGEAIDKALKEFETDLKVARQCFERGDYPKALTHLDPGFIEHLRELLATDGGSTE